MLSETTSCGAETRSCSTAGSVAFHANGEAEATAPVDTEGTHRLSKMVPGMKIEILVRKFASFDLEPPLPPELGKRGLFSNDLVLERYNNKMPGNGLPQDEQQRRAGTHSGFVAILRIVGENDAFYPPGSYLFQYEGTYKFNAVPNTPLQKGQVTARGVLLVDHNLNALEPPITFAITGGTDAYVMARGQITEGVSNPADRLLAIEV
jgi:hypothetical protein